MIEKPLNAVIPNPVSWGEESWFRRKKDFSRSLPAGEEGSK